MSGSAIAEWAEAGRNKDSIVYYDPATIRMSGSKVIIWSLHDYKTARGQVEYRSVTLESEYDCIKKQSRRLFLSFYQKNMGTGTTIRKDIAPRSWLPIATGTIKESMWKIACRK
jgi:hypothetical protein